MKDKINDVTITTPYITLGQLLKLVDLIGYGGEAKDFLASNIILVDDLEDNRRGRKLYEGSIVTIKNQKYRISK